MRDNILGEIRKLTCTFASAFFPIAVGKLMI